MNITKRLLSILLFAAISVGAWAIETDADGTYLIGSTDDWNTFASGINGGSIALTANAKLTADIAVSTMIGSESKKYAGVFDGKTHTLNVTISGSSQFAAPFHYVKGGTIKNLRVEGTVSSSYAHMSGLIGRAYGKISIENCIVAANIYMTSDYAAGFVGNGGSIAYGGPSEVVMRNCLFIGSFTGVSGNRSKASAFWGWGKSTPVFINCLENGTYTNISEFSPYMFEGTDGENSETTTNSYYKHGSISLDGISNASNMTDGEIVSLLGDGWVLDPITKQPVLNQFASLKQDTEGYYLIGTAQDWQVFAALVETTPSANAKMTADIDLGDCQTMIGATTAEDVGPFFSGIFDGQGHTLTIAYNGIGSESVGAPFAKISGATIKNLHVKGSINSGGFHPSVISDSFGTSTIENVWSELNITSTRSGWVECGSIIGCAKNGSLTIKDCLFTGSVTADGGYNGCFVGYNWQGTTTMTNCLSLGTFCYPGGYNSWTSSPAGSHSNCYVKQFQNNDIPDAMKITDAQLADGTIATALGNAWVQDGSTPMLKLFASESGITTGEAIQVTSDKKQVASEVWYSISGQKLSGRPAERGIYIRNGKKIVVN